MQPTGSRIRDGPEQRHLPWFSSFQVGSRPPIDNFPHRRRTLAITAPAASPLPIPGIADEPEPCLTRCVPSPRYFHSSRHALPHVKTEMLTSRSADLRE